MTKIRHLKNAPITEALIDFRVELPPDFKASTFSVLEDKLSSRYPKFNKRRLIEQKFELKKGQQLTSHTTEDALYGFFFKSEDELNVAQFRMDGFTFSRLKPYTTWKEVLNEARDLWKIYIDVASPEIVTRIATRYINHLKLKLPLSLTDFPQYFTTPLPVPADLQEDLRASFSRIVLHDPNHDILTNIVQALEKDVDPEFITIILDIDAYKKQEFEIDDEKIWDTFELLHEAKNKAFFGSITEKTAKLFE